MGKKKKATRFNFWIPVVTLRQYKVIAKASGYDSVAAWVKRACANEAAKAERS